MTADTQAQGDKHEPVRKALEMLHNTLAVATKPKHHDEATARFRARLTPYDIAHLLNEYDRLAAALQGRAQEGEPSEAWGVEVAPEFQAEADRMSQEAIALWAAVRKDAERYRWLRDSDAIHPATDRVPEHRLEVFRYDDKEERFLPNGCAVSDLDASIDFAMAHDEDWRAALAQAVVKHSLTTDTQGDAARAGERG